MKFIIGEDFWTMLERASYRGAIGLYYSSTWSGVLAYVIFASIMILAVIGLFTVVKMLLTGKPSSSGSSSNKSGLTKQEREWLYGKKK